MLVACGRVGFEPNPETDLLEAVDARPGSPCSELRTCGDLDGDGMVGTDDILALEAMLTTPGGLDACLAWAADVSGDGTLDDADRTALAELLSGGAPQCAP